MGLVGFNKTFLFAVVDAPGCACDPRIVNNSILYQDVLAGEVIPNHTLYLDTFGKVLLVTIRDRAFPRHS